MPVLLGFEPGIARPASRRRSAISREAPMIRSLVPQALNRHHHAWRPEGPAAAGHRPPGADPRPPAARRDDRQDRTDGQHQPIRAIALASVAVSRRDPPTPRVSSDSHPLQAPLEVDPFGRDSVRSGGGPSRNPNACRAVLESGWTPADRWSPTCWRTVEAAEASDPSGSSDGTETDRLARPPSGSAATVDGGNRRRFDRVPGSVWVVASSTSRLIRPPARKRNGPGPRSRRWPRPGPGSSAVRVGPGPSRVRRSSEVVMATVRWPGPSPDRSGRD